MSSLPSWKPGARAIIAMNIAGLLLLPVGIAGYASLWAIGHGATEFSVGGPELLIGVFAIVALTALLLVLHEGVHGLIIKVFGGSPQYGATMIGGVLPALYCTAPGKWFTKTQFLTVALAPLVALGIGCGLIVAFVPYGGWMVIPAAIHLSGCVGDMAMAWVALRQPKGTMIEDMKSGMRFRT